MHADLQAETASKKHKLYYFNDPTKLVENLNEIEKRAPKVALPKYSDYFPPAPSACPKCGKDLQDAGFSPSMYGGFTWKKRCVGCGFRWDTGEFMDD